MTLPQRTSDHRGHFAPLPDLPGGSSRLFLFPHIFFPSREILEPKRRWINGAILL